MAGGRLTLASTRCCPTAGPRRIPRQSGYTNPEPTPLAPEPAALIAAPAGSDAGFSSLGDVLYQIDPAPYQYTVDQSESQWKAAKSNVLALEAGLRMAMATVEKAQADVAATKAAFDVAVAIAKMDPAAHPDAIAAVTRQPR